MSAPSELARRAESTDHASEDDRLARLALNHAVEPADPQIGRLLELHSPSEVLAAIRSGQLADLDPDPARRDRLTDRCTGLRLRLEPGRVEAGIAAADSVFARFITPSDRDWPPRLDDLGQQRPIGFWAIGSWDAAEMLSIVGARACTGYGSYMAGALGADLASAGVTVVSGAALGIDAAAHRGALAVGGGTVAVLACGIDRVYPRAHEALLRTIGERGAVLSELPPGAAPTRFRFLHRNRIIAALGIGTVVVEAARRSGSLVTARLAAELGRVVMAVPGPVTSDQSAGAHELIRDGATLVAQASHVREACASLTAACREPPEEEVVSTTSVARIRSKPPARVHQAVRAEPADPVEELLLEALPSAAADAGADVFALARATGIGPDAVFAALGRLAASGRAVKAGGGWMLSTKR
jgi:DNA processing protein